MMVALWGKKGKRKGEFPSLSGGKRRRGEKNPAVFYPPGSKKHEEGRSRDRAGRRGGERRL